MWITNPERDRIKFVQELKGVNGYSYVYTKRVRLEKGKPELVLEHSLKNTGKRVIETEVYNHDFCVIDGTPTGPALSVPFPFQPKAVQDLKGAAETQGNKFVYLRELKAGNHDSVATYLEGYGDTAHDFDISVENSATGAGVQETGDRPISK
ncbi:MAG: hypothetical protein M3Y72_04845, partial [Acidobacteriota bacterium]|nr:hypothetical protein [Acidobacteriota bacterium]